MAVIILITALITIATIVVAIITGRDLVRQRKELAELEQKRADLMNHLNQEEARRKVVQGNLELTEKARQQKLDLIAEIKKEIEELGGDKDREIGVARDLDQRSSEDVI